MKRIILFTLLCVGIAYGAVAQKNITIRGKVVDGAGKRVELRGYTDKISQSELLLDQMEVSEDQSFELRCFARYPQLVVLQIENYSQSFYVEPGRDYNLYIGHFDWNVDETKNVFLDPVTLPVEFLNLPADDVNLQIDRFNQVVADYIAAHRVHFDQRFRPQRQYFDSLVAEVQKRCPDSDNEFFNRYKQYQLAVLKMNFKFDSRRNIFNEFIKNQPVLSHDENYMTLFTALYSNAISKGTKDISVYRLAHWVYNLDYTTYLDSIGMDPMLRHEQVRELAALLALKESYYNFRYYDSKMVVKMVEQIAQHSKFPEHKVIAQHIIDGFHQCVENAEVPHFLLPNVEKEMVSLDSFKGKWVYLSFVRVGEPSSLAEIETLAHFREQIYSQYSNVAFVTIDCDREFQKMYHFLKNSKHGNRYDWTWLHFNNDFDLLSHYRVCSYPTFILINPEGQLQYDITPAPSTGFLLDAPWQHQAAPSNDPSQSFFPQE